MAHFAKLDENNIVTEVIVVHNNELLDNGVESEAKGISFCQSIFGGTWLQTSYNGSIRTRFAAIGYTYSPELDAFIPPKPYPSWTLDMNTLDWIPPVMPLNDGKKKEWNELEQVWMEVPTV